MRRPYRSYHRPQANDVEEDDEAGWDSSGRERTAPAMTHVDQKTAAAAVGGAVDVLRRYAYPRSGRDDPSPLPIGGASLGLTQPLRTIDGIDATENSSRAAGRQQQPQRPAS